MIQRKEAKTAPSRKIRKPAAAQVAFDSFSFQGGATKPPPSKKKHAAMEQTDKAQPEQLLTLQSAPEVQASEADFEDPFGFFSKLYREGYQKFGIVKILPPKS